MKPFACLTDVFSAIQNETCYAINLLQDCEKQKINGYGLHSHDDIHDLLVAIGTVNELTNELLK